jgi:CheY-like chemotaxis protein
VAGAVEPLEAQGLHDFDLVARHGALGIGFVIGAGVGLAAAAIAAQVGADHGEAFRQPRERFTSSLGLPRTDLFFDDANRARAEAAIRERYDVPPGRRVLLYAPTFRGDTMHAARYDDSLDLAALHRAIGDEWIVLLRLHPFVRQAASIGAAPAGFVRDVSDWPDMNELMFVADLLVTDFLMPGMNGVQLIEHSTAIVPHMNVLLITGYSTIAEGPGAKYARLAKPYRQAELSRRVAEVLERRVGGDVLPFQKPERSTRCD